METKETNSKSASIGIIISAILTLGLPIVIYGFVTSNVGGIFIFSTSILLLASACTLFYLLRKHIFKKLTTVKDRLNKNNASKTLIGLVILIFTSFSLVGTIMILQGEQNGAFKAIAFNLLLVWLCIFLCYFIWAVYFYNFNFGISNYEWKQIHEAKRNRDSGKPYSIDTIKDEPKYNPHREETFGLPPGTVRGMIAFTLVFGAIALLIVSFDNTIHLSNDSFFFDQFEFFKTAFLMMIAFYFGTRSLKYLQQNGVVKLDGTTKHQPVAPVSNAPAPPQSNPETPVEEANMQQATSPEEIAIIEVVATDSQDSTEGKEKIKITDPMA